MARKIEKRAEKEVQPKRQGSLNLIAQKIDGGSCIGRVWALVTLVQRCTPDSKRRMPGGPNIRLFTENQFAFENSFALPEILEVSEAAPDAALLACVACFIAPLLLSPATS